MTVNFRYSGKTHVGLKRSVNEDSIVMLPEQQIWAVSDGMGGHAAGDVASQMVVDAIALLPEGMDPTTRMDATIGATVVVLLLTGEHFLALWTGDSRIYRLRDGRIEMLTTDHSVVAELVLNGSMTWDEAELHPQSNQITRAVGVGDELELEKVHGTIRPATGSCCVRTGCRSTRPSASSNGR